MTCINIAQREDLPRICELVKMGVEELPVHYYDVDDSVLADTVYKSWLMAPCFTVVVEGKIVGCASCDLGSMPWAKDVYLTTNMVYVLPEYRNNRIIKELYKNITKYADLQGILYLDNFVSNADKIDGRARLARLHKLDVVGVSIMHNGDE
jgi:GNAT superfamily N-acetyltransferase